MTLASMPFQGWSTEAFEHLAEADAVTVVGGDPEDQESLLHSFRLALETLRFSMRTRRRSRRLSDMKIVIAAVDRLARDLYRLGYRLRWRLVARQFQIWSC